MWLTNWFKRFLGFQKIHEVRILESVLDDLTEMARSSHPKEMLAFLSATKGIEDGVLIIDEIQIQAYDASTHSATVALHLLPTFTSIVGTVHSHPSSNRRPSSPDRNLFGRYGVVHGIIGSPYKKETISFYDKQGREIDVTFV